MSSFSGLRWQHLLTTLMGLMISTGIALHSVQDDEPVDPIDQKMCDLEKQVLACVRNRMYQLTVELELSDAQASKLRVLVKSLKREDYSWTHNDSFSNPMLSEKWQRILKRVFDEDQAMELVELDRKMDAKRSESLKQFELAPDSNKARADLVLSSMQRRAYLTERQRNEVHELLESYFDTPTQENWDANLSDFYDSNRTKLEEILLGTQRIFFVDPIPFQKLVEQNEWADQWRNLSCQTCHVDS